MDFNFTADQLELRALTEQILADHDDDARLEALDAAGTFYDDELLRTLGESGLLGVIVGDEDGGTGLGIIEAAMVLERVGAHASRVPLHAVSLLGLLPIARYGTAEQRSRLLPDALVGKQWLTAGLEEVGNADLLRPGTRATRSGDGWTVTGTKTGVPVADGAARILVPAATDEDEVVLLLVDPRASGVTLEEQTTGSRAPEALVTLDGVEVPAADVLGSTADGAEMLRTIVEHATVGLCALQLGAAESALAGTADWAKQRHQFGRPIGTFQAVSLRLADAYIALEGNRLTLWQAAWRLSENLPAAQEVAVAKYWAAEASTVVMTVSHRIQAGVGVDLTSKLPRFTLLSRHTEFSLGAGRVQSLRLGTLLADAAVGDAVEA